jgi:hypothetical protein
MLAADKACKTAGAPEQLIAERLDLHSLFATICDPIDNNLPESLQNVRFCLVKETFWAPFIFMSMC